MFSITENNDATIAKPCSCRYMLESNWKYVVYTQNVNISIDYLLGLFCLYIDKGSTCYTYKKFAQQVAHEILTTNYGPQENTIFVNSEKVILDSLL